MLGQPGKGDPTTCWIPVERWSGCSHMRLFSIALFPHTIQHSNTFPTIPIAQIPQNRCARAILVSDVGNYRAVSAVSPITCMMRTARTGIRTSNPQDLIAGSPMLLNRSLTLQSWLPYALNNNTLFCSLQTSAPTIPNNSISPLPTFSFASQ